MRILDRLKYAGMFLAVALAFAACGIVWAQPAGIGTPGTGIVIDTRPHNPAPIRGTTTCTNTKPIICY